MRHGKRILSEQSCLDSIEEAYAVASAAMAKDLESEDAQIGIDAFVEKKVPASSVLRLPTYLRDKVLVISRSSAKDVT